MRLGDIYALCRFCCQNCSKKYIYKERKIKPCVSPRIPAPRGDTSAVTPLHLLPCITVTPGTSRGPGAGPGWDRLLVRPPLPLLPSCQAAPGSLQASAWCGWCHQS